ncbi:restriction endonuclease subunit S [Enterococcus faecium]|uniref:restriction endonuclease subunit S n=1 Tax=Enterococcus TaxID=1350 RepID=UPI000CF250AF|nr:MULTISPECIES: restriction endonuclease subunit S [Enterococcus]MBP4087496.1 restriction endonuclease subunit S [Enterococcus lactis]MDX8094345.1 restriction endonuclease subunit S [Enterococcus lactis]PQC08474.1 restriction endonuclease subunit S [Enterococcus faecium]QXX73112.1 restriction endonuclease subunit S [Enterococcus lactis]TKK92308.1 restriction endonuclease subunit S [Enterococcus faecium]
MSNNTQPEIRFPGFTEDWEERKLNELAEFNPKSDLPERFEYVDLESVVGTELVRHRTENRYSAPSRAQRLAKKNDVFYQTVRPYQKNNYLFDLPYDNYVFSTGYAQMRPIGNGYFLLTLIQEEKFVNRVLERSTGTSYPAINSNDLAKLPVKVPADIQEQQKIGTFFKQLDDTIALHQRKLDLLKETKKGFLQKMFPKNGAKVPEIRFPGFTEDWEQRKLGELAESFEYGLNASAKKFDGSNKYIRITDIDDINHKFNQSGVTSPDIDFANADNYKLKKGDILFARTGASVGKTYMYRESDGLVYYAGFLIRARIKSKISSEFVFQTTFTDSYNQFIKITSQRSGQPGVNAEEYSNFKIMIPNYEEQDAIGCFFKKVDDTLALHQRKLDLLKETKKGFLQKMFV